MRIACITQAFPVLSETFVRRQVEGLHHLGQDVVVFAERTEGDPATRPSEIPVAQVGRAGAASLADSALCATRLAFQAPHALRLLSREASAPHGGRLSLLSRLGVALVQPGFDLVHCHFGPVGLRYRFTADLWKAPLVVTFYGHDVSRFPLIHGRDVYRPLFRTASLVLALSEEMATRVAALGCPRDKLRIHPLGVDLREWAFRPARRRLPLGGGRLLSVARLVEKKGIEYAIRAVALLLPRYPRLTYDIIGDGPLRAPLEQLARELGVIGAVRFHGSRDPSLTRLAMASADLFVLPSVTAADGDQEGTPTVLLEAQALGLPVVSTRHSGIPEIVRQEVTGLLVAERDAGALAGAIERLLGDGRLRDRMGKAGRHLVETGFDIERLNRRLLGYYEELVRGPKRAAPPGGRAVPELSTR